MWPATRRITEHQRRQEFDPVRSRELHPDFHAWWIDPKDSRHMLIGCDGGFYVTYDRGTTWDHMNVLALGQFYHVAVDSRKPYRVFGGLQDNGSWVGRRTCSVRSGRQRRLGHDPRRRRLRLPRRSARLGPGLFESQNGNINRHNLRTGERAASDRSARPAKTTDATGTRVHPFQPQPGIVYAARSTCRAR